MYWTALVGHEEKELGVLDGTEEERVHGYDDEILSVPNEVHPLWQRFFRVDDRNGREDVDFRLCNSDCSGHEEIVLFEFLVS